MKPFWLSLESEQLPVLDYLTEVLLKDESQIIYEEALDRAVNTHQCRIVPFFGAFLTRLDNIFRCTPSLVVLAEDGQGVEVKNYTVFSYFMKLNSFEY